MSSWRLTENKRLFLGSGRNSWYHPLPFLIPSSPSSPRSLHPSSFQAAIPPPHPFILQPLIHSSLLRTTSIPLLDLIPSSRVVFFGASSSGGEPPGLGHPLPRPDAPLPLPTVSHISNKRQRFLQMKKNPKHLDAEKGWSAEYRWPSRRKCETRRERKIHSLPAAVPPRLSRLPICGQTTFPRGLPCSIKTRGGDRWRLLLTWLKLKMRLVQDHCCGAGAARNIGVAARRLDGSPKKNEPGWAAITTSHLDQKLG